MGNITLPSNVAGAILNTFTRVDSGTGQTVHVQGVVPVNPFTAASGSITANGGLVEVSVADASSCSVSINGTYSGTFALEATDDGTTWYPIDAARLSGNVIETSTGALTNASRAWSMSVVGMVKVRIRATAFTSGSATVRLSPSQANVDPAPSVRTTTVTGTVAANATQVLGTAATRWFAQLSDGTNSPAIKAASTAAAFTDPAIAVDMRPGGIFPAAATMADGDTNPSVTQIAVNEMLFNGATWDRKRGNFNTTTGDTGAKTATFNGATQTNYNAKGAVITLLVGAVSGTTPTLTAQAQFSPDGGTTWVNIAGAVTPSITASGNYTLTIYPGVTVAANAAVSSPLPRTWRLVYTIGGTTPSFTLTNVHVAYAE